MATLTLGKRQRPLVKTFHEAKKDIVVRSYVPAGIQRLSSTSVSTGKLVIVMKKISRHR